MGVKGGGNTAKTYSVDRFMRGMSVWSRELRQVPVPEINKVVFDTARELFERPPWERPFDRDESEAVQIQCEKCATALFIIAAFVQGRINYAEENRTDG